MKNNKIAIVLISTLALGIIFTGCKQKEDTNTLLNQIDQNVSNIEAENARLEAERQASEEVPKQYTDESFVGDYSGAKESQPKDPDTVLVTTTNNNIDSSKENNTENQDTENQNTDTTDSKVLSYEELKGRIVELSGEASADLISETLYNEISNIVEIQIADDHFKITDPNGRVKDVYIGWETGIKPSCYIDRIEYDNGDTSTTTDKPSGNTETETESSPSSEVKKVEYNEIQISETKDLKAALQESLGCNESDAEAAAQLVSDKISSDIKSVAGWTKNKVVVTPTDGSKQYIEFVKEDSEKYTN